MWGSQITVTAGLENSWIFENKIETYNNDQEINAINYNDRKL